MRSWSVLTLALFGIAGAGCGEQATAESSSKIAPFRSTESNVDARAPSAESIGRSSVAAEIVRKRQGRRPTLAERSGRPTADSMTSAVNAAETAKISKRLGPDGKPLMTPELRQAHDEMFYRPDREEAARRALEGKEKERSARPPQAKSEKRS